MKKPQNKIKITQTIIQAAAKYKAEMVGRSFMYVYDDNYIEVIYRAKDFLHLTGVDTPLSAEAFFKEAARATLRHNQIYFSSRHPYDICARKTAQLPNITAAVNSDVLLLENLSTSTYTYKFALSELHFTLALSEDTDNLGNIAGTNYVVRSLRIENGIERSENAHEISFIFSRQNNMPLYDKINYCADGADISALPEKILKKLSFPHKVKAPK